MGYGDPISYLSNRIIKINEKHYLTDFGILACRVEYPDT